MHSSLIGKIQKANLYAREPDRLDFTHFSTVFRGEQRLLHRRATSKAAGLHL